MAFPGSSPVPGAQKAISRRWLDKLSAEEKRQVGPDGNVLEALG